MEIDNKESFSDDALIAENLSESLTEITEDFNHTISPVTEKSVDTKKANTSKKQPQKKTPVTKKDAKTEKATYNKKQPKKKMSAKSKLNKFKKEEVGSATKETNVSREVENSMTLDSPSEGKPAKPNVNLNSSQNSTLCDKAETNEFTKCDPIKKKLIYPVFGKHYIR